MKIKCIADKANSNNDILLEWAKNSELEITIGKEYVVLAISKYLNNFFFYIISDENYDYPLAFPADFFEIIDNKISKYWDTSMDKIACLSNIEINNNDVISFSEWSHKKDIFYENLLEEASHEVKIFNEYRDKILSE